MHLKVSSLSKKCRCGVSFGLKILIIFQNPLSKAGRPPTRKFTDRKAYKRQKHSAINGATEFVGNCTSALNSNIFVSVRITFSYQISSNHVWLNFLSWTRLWA